MKTVVGLATRKRRIEGAMQTICALQPQCDEMHVFVHEYGRRAPLPRWLFQWSNVHVYSDREYPDRGALDKHLFCPEDDSNAVFLSVDDDILYPADYVAKTLERLLEYGPRYIVSWHGSYYEDPPIRNYHEQRRALFHFWREIPEDLHVNVLGAGCMARFANALHVDWKRYTKYYSDDFIIASCAAEQQLGKVVLAHESGWIKDNRLVTRADAVATRLMANPVDALEVADFLTEGWPIWREDLNGEWKDCRDYSGQPEIPEWDALSRERTSRR